MTPIDASLLLQAAAAAAGDQHHPEGALYVVATPIGNRADLTLRAIHVLGLVDAIACEDTRHTAPLLRLLGIDGRALIALHRHNERDASLDVVARLARGERVACVSDAGTPAISDPGAELVRAVRDAGFRAIPIPGASSAVAALSVAGDTSSGGFFFSGFLPARGQERAAALARLVESDVAAVVFEAPHRIDALGKELAERCDDRAVTVCRELTKQFEQVATMPANALPGWLAADVHRQRGEFVLVIHGRSRTAETTVAEAHDPMLRTLLASLPLKQAVALAAELSGAPRNALYERALALKDGSA